MTIVLNALSAELAKALEKKAQRRGMTLEQAATEALAHGLTLQEDDDMANGEKKRIDLTGIAGTMSEEDARAIEETVKWMDQGDLATRS